MYMLWDTGGHQSITPCRASHTLYSQGLFTGEKNVTEHANKAQAYYPLLCTMHPYDTAGNVFIEF